MYPVKDISNLMQQQLLEKSASATFFFGHFSCFSGKDLFKTRTCISSGSPSYFRAAPRWIDQTIGRLLDLLTFNRSPRVKGNHNRANLVAKCQGQSQLGKSCCQVSKAITIGQILLPGGFWMNIRLCFCEGRFQLGEIWLLKRKSTLSSGHWLLTQDRNTPARAQTSIHTCVTIATPATVF